MGTTFVSIENNGFWMKDVILELWLRLLSLHIEDPATEEESRIADPIRTQWLLASRGYFTGCVPIDLDEDVQTEEGKKLVVNAINSLLEALADAPDTLSKGVLNLMGLSGEFVGDFDTFRLIEVGNAFLDLIEGKVGNDSSDASFMPGSMKEMKEYEQSKRDER